MIYEKRGSWCFRDANDKLHKFNTKEEAEKAAGVLPSVEEQESQDAEEESNFEETEEHSEETGSDEQKVVHKSKGRGKKKI